MLSRTLWLRHETKPFEERVALTPSAAKQLQMRGHDVRIERSSTRIFTDAEYEKLGLPLVDTNSWRSAPEDAIILGLKELEEESSPLIHRHIFFAHCYKGQTGADELLTRFALGDGKLYDLEFLVDRAGRRIAAFGVWAGFVGAALAIDFWIDRQLGLNPNDKAPLKPWTSSQDLVLYLKERLASLGRAPSTLIIGARGRCGRGAKKLLDALAINTVAWNSKETKGRGPIKEILDFDVFINCALMMSKTKPFLTPDLLKQPRKLQVISDVGCDPTGPCNPIPIYSDTTSMDHPAKQLSFTEQDLWITAIDHLPSLLPRESSDDFCSQLLPHLEVFLSGRIEDTPWERSLSLFYRHLGRIGVEPTLQPEANLSL
ncbi:MAG: saccharopine dehydrogenase [Halobacteriovorax sp.]|nr:saccharopine dehydrogenase [Halobacteriovorax sp.]